MQQLALIRNALQQTHQTVLSHCIALTFSKITSNAEIRSVAMNRSAPWNSPEVSSASYTSRTFPRATSGRGSVVVVRAAAAIVVVLVLQKWT